jgi:hypothetical protein
MPTHPNAVIAAQLTGRTIYLELCDPDSPKYDERYIRVVTAITEGSPKPEAKANAFRHSVLAQIDLCLYRDCPRGCPRTICHAGRGGYGEVTTLENCRKCLESM